MTGSTIYLDHCATTPVRSEVMEAMLPFLTADFGNAGSIHAFGRVAKAAVDHAREQVAALLNADPREIIFTSGGTESDNLAIRGTIAAAPPSRRGVVVSTIEHHAVLHAAGYARRYDGADLRAVPVDAAGRVDPDEVASLMDDTTAVVSVLHVNNETGVVQPIERIAERCAERGVVFHTDAVQSVGRVSLDVQRTPVSLAALSGHKLYAPKGVGACYLRKGVELVPQSAGGAQERGRRAGTENVPGIVALGVACELARTEMAQEAERLTRLRDRLEAGILETVPNAYVNGGGADRSPHVLNMCFKAADGESLILALDMEGIAVSSGSACSAGSLDPSHVLLAMGQSREAAQSALRFSFGRANSADDVNRVLSILPGIVQRARRSE